MELRQYKYVKILAVVISGRWHTPKRTKGEAFISLLDKRFLREHESVILTANATPAETEFQIKVHPDYSMVTEDCLNEPFELFVNLRAIDMAVGTSPLSLELAFSVIGCDVVILKSLKMKILSGTDAFDNATGEVGSDRLTEFYNSSGLTSIRQHAHKSKTSISSQKRVAFHGKKGSVWKEVNLPRVMKVGTIESDMSDSEKDQTVRIETIENGKLPTDNSAKSAVVDGELVGLQPVSRSAQEHVV